MNIETLEVHANPEMQKNILALAKSIDAIADISSRSGISIKTYSEESWMRFIDLPAERQSEILRSFTSYQELCSSAEADGISFLDNQDLMRYVLKKLGLRVSNDYLDSLVNDDLIEVYNLDHNQIFRNLRFFDVTDYSLLDLLTYEWEVLYERGQAMTEKTMKAIHNAVAGNETVPMGVEPHPMRECLSESQPIVEVAFKLITPTYNIENWQQKLGYTISCGARVLDSKTADREKIHFL